MKQVFDDINVLKANDAMRPCDAFGDFIL